MFFSAMQYLADVSDEVSHDQLLTLMLTMFIAWPTLLLAIYGWISTRVRRRDRADDQQERADGIIDC